MQTHEITLDMKKNKHLLKATRVLVRKGEDNTQKILAHLTLDGIPFTPTCANARLRILHVDGTFAICTAEISDNSVSVVLPSEALNAEGVCRLAYFEFYDNDAIETTENFTLEILANVDTDGVASQSYSDELDALIERLKAVKDGKDGSNGQDGYTPKRGIDYWTEADKREIQAYINKLLGVIENGAY